MPIEKLPGSNEQNDLAEQARGGPLSLSRLREAFAAMLGEGGRESRAEAAVRPGREPEDVLPAGETRQVPCEISPRSVVEAMLFVGRPDNGPLSARELAAAMRGVSPKEIDAAVQELNTVYDAEQTPYWIEYTGGGYRLVLRPEFERVRDKFYGRVKEARLSPAALEVLSVLAYNQPATVEQLNELRGAPSGAALATLVRRKLVGVERPVEGGQSQYSTTERFLKLFGLGSLSELPRSEELEQA
jgi:segregation and condensation protein B